jgi:hypothetical protein
MPAVGHVKVPSGSLPTKTKPNNVARVPSRNIDTRDVESPAVVYADAA